MDAKVLGWRVVPDPIPADRDTPANRSTRGDIWFKLPTDPTGKVEATVTAKSLSAFVGQTLRWLALSDGRTNSSWHHIEGDGQASWTDACYTRRCLASMLVERKLVTQPQFLGCYETVHVTSLKYQTIKVDTKNLRLVSTLDATMEWQDDDLSWDYSLYPYDEVILPVSKVWTPDIFVSNGISANTENSFRDLIVYHNGLLRHRVVITAEVNCEFNLFNYPFAEDSCPVVLETWSTQGCAITLIIDHFNISDGSHGDWETVSADLVPTNAQGYFISVRLRIRQQNPFITLMLPSILIILADMVSFALPLGCGERNSFKVTLVLSFTMFLLILNDQLPGDSECSPVIKTHFCVCLVMLVVSMLVSMVLTRVAQDGGLVFCCFPRRPQTAIERKGDDQDGGDISVIRIADSGENQMYRKVMDFLNAINAREADSDRKQALADKIDKAFFWFYFTAGTVYFSAMITVMVKYECKVSHVNIFD
ncbi:5-hydroxytryptamine receptor 3A-like isoform X2 [Stigmatopora nigra]